MKTNKAHEEKKKIKAQNEQEFRPEVEHAFKQIKRVMSWIVGIAFASVLILPQFNDPVLDKITKVLFLRGVYNKDLLLKRIVRLLEVYSNPVLQDHYFVPAVLFALLSELFQSF